LNLKEGVGAHYIKELVKSKTRKDLPKKNLPDLPIAKLLVNLGKNYLEPEFTFNDFSGDINFYVKGKIPGFEKIWDLIVIP
jgi:hypothetical protein